MGDVFFPGETLLAGRVPPSDRPAPGPSEWQIRGERQAKPRHASARICLQHCPPPLHSKHRKLQQISNIAAIKCALYGQATL